MEREDAHEMTISERIQAYREDMTRSERQLVTTLLDDYPIAGLCSITELATRAEVSTTTITRLLQKIGLDGYAQFQATLRGELKEMISDPVAKRNTWKTAVPEEHILSRYGRQAMENQQRTLDEIDPAEFDKFCDLLCQSDRRIFVAGGRISNALAQYLYLHLQMIRPDVRLMPPGGSWPHDLLDLRQDDIVVLM
jgi:DNA-binding MurR/RpiR family transcriptional regulator